MDEGGGSKAVLALLDRYSVPRMRDDHVPEQRRPGPRFGPFVDHPCVTCISSYLPLLYQPCLSVFWQSDEAWFLCVTFRKICVPREIGWESRCRIFWSVEYGVI